MASPIGADNFMYPHGAPEFTGPQMIIALLRVGLIFGLLGLWWCGAVPIHRGARLGRYLALVMMAVLTVIEGIAVTVQRSPTDGTPPGIGVVYGASTLLLGVALLAEGLGVASAGAWQGWKRWLPLSLGVWLLLGRVPSARAELRRCPLGDLGMAVALRPARLGADRTRRLRTQPSHC